MKNSSRFEETMARNLSRSRIGSEISAASSSTRVLNWSHDSSRLRNNCGSWSSAIRRAPCSAADAASRWGGGVVACIAGSIQLISRA